MTLRVSTKSRFLPFSVNWKLSVLMLFFFFFFFFFLLKIIALVLSGDTLNPQKVNQSSTMSRAFCNFLTANSAEVCFVQITPSSANWDKDIPSKSFRASDKVSMITH